MPSLPPGWWPGVAAEVCGVMAVCLSFAGSRECGLQQARLPIVGGRLRYFFFADAHAAPSAQHVHVPAATAMWRSLPPPPRGGSGRGLGCTCGQPHFLQLLRCRCLRAPATVSGLWQPLPLAGGGHRLNPCSSCCMRPVRCVASFTLPATMCKPMLLLRWATLHAPLRGGLGSQREGCCGCGARGASDWVNPSDAQGGGVINAIAGSHRTMNDVAIRAFAAMTDEGCVARRARHQAAPLRSRIRDHQAETAPATAPTSPEAAARTGTTTKLAKSACSRPDACPPPSPY